MALYTIQLNWHFLGSFGLFHLVNLKDTVTDNQIVYFVTDNQVVYFVTDTLVVYDTIIRRDTVDPSPSQVRGRSTPTQYRYLGKPAC